MFLLDLYEFSLLQNMNQAILDDKVATQLEKLRFIILALQTGRKNILSASCAKFDACKLINVKLHLNSSLYLYDDINLDFDMKGYAILYNMYALFRKAYYERILLGYR